MDSSNRIHSVDVGRGFAILCMIAAHISVTFWIINDYGTFLAAPFFLLISGISFEFFLGSRIRNKIPIQKIFIESFSRAFFIYTIPLIPYAIVSIFNPSRFQLVHWGVFQVIAVGYIIGFFLCRRWKLQAITIILIFFLTFIAQTYFSQPLSFLLNDFSPVLPWLAYFVMGQIIHEIYANKKGPSYLLLLASFFTFILSFLIFYLSNIPVSTESRTQLPIFFLLSSLFLLIQSIFIILVDRSHFWQYIFNPLERIGKIAFTVYYLQYPLIFGAVFIINKLHLFPTSIIPAILVIIGIFALLEKYWEKYEYIFGFEWIIRKGSRFLNEWLISIFRSKDNMRQSIE